VKNIEQTRFPEEKKKNKSKTINLPTKTESESDRVDIYETERSQKVGRN